MRSAAREKGGDGVDRTVRDGFVAPGFEEVAIEFERNFTDREELGAAFAATLRGEPVVDLWGGLANRATNSPWRSDTVQIIFSGSKGLVATCLMVLIERGLLDINAPVAAYWPEFAEFDKSRILIKHIASHTSRLPGLETPVTWRDATDDRRMAQLLAHQRPSTDDRAPVTYHALTFGWILGEVIRRIDGRSIGRFFAEEVARPLELDLWIGLPPEIEPRVSRVELSPGWGGSNAFNSEVIAHDRLLESVFANPVRYDPVSFPWNERAWHAAEIPAANAMGTARSIARLYSRLDRIVGPETLALARRPLSVRDDPTLGKPMAFGLGFQLQTGDKMFGPPPDAFGHDGSGGSCHGCWPTEQVGFSYAMNRLRDGIDRRSRALLQTLFDCVSALKGSAPEDG